MKEQEMVMSDQPKCITLLIDGLGMGGAERVITNMANYWAERGWQIVLITTADPDEQVFFPLHPAVQLRRVHVPTLKPSIMHRLTNAVRRFVLLRKVLRDAHPMVAISFLDDLNVRMLIASLGLRIPVIVSERGNPYLLPLRRPWKLLRRLLYPHAACVVMQTARASAVFPPAIQARSRIIPNPVALPAAYYRPHRRTSTRTVVALGRLADVKQYDLLIGAFAQIADRYPCWTLDIWGEGPEREHLQRVTADWALTDRVHLRGNAPDPFAVLCHADLFVLTSSSEGFPNALLEAMACGVPVVSFDCPFGPREIIRDGIDGILVPPNDVRALAETLDHLMGNPTERERLSKRGPDVLDRFSTQRIMHLWEALIWEVTHATS